MSAPAKSILDAIYAAIAHTSATTACHGVGADVIAKVGDIATDTNLSAAMRALKTAPPSHGTSVHDATCSKKREIPYLISTYETSTATTYTEVWRKFGFDKSQFDKIASINLTAWIEQEAGTSYAAYAKLYNITAGAEVTGSEITGSYAGGAGAVLVSADCQANLPASLQTYDIVLKVASGGTVVVKGVYLLVRQSE